MARPTIRASNVHRNLLSTSSDCVFYTEYVRNRRLRQPDSLAGSAPLSAGKNYPDLRQKKIHSLRTQFRETLKILEGNLSASGGSACSKRGV